MRKIFCDLKFINFSTKNLHPHYNLQSFRIYTFTQSIITFNLCILIITLVPLQSQSANIWAQKWTGPISRWVQVSAGARSALSICKKKLPEAEWEVHRTQWACTFCVSGFGGYKSKSKEMHAAICLLRRFLRKNSVCAMRTLVPAVYVQWLLLSAHFYLLNLTWILIAAAVRQLYVYLAQWQRRNFTAWTRQEIAFSIEKLSAK